MAAITICSDFGAPENKVSHCFHCFPIYLPWNDRTECHDLSFLNAELSANFFTLSLSFFIIYSLIYLLIVLYNIVLVSLHIDLNLPWLYMCSPFWTPLPPRALPIPLGHPSASALSILLCIKPGLAIHFTYGNLHVSMPFSHIIPPSPSPKESKRLFNTSVSLLLYLNVHRSTVYNSQDMETT